MYDPDDEYRKERNTEPRNLGTAYLLAAGSLLGLAGLHRFYMGKIGTGILWCLTWGCFGFGLVYDLVTMRDQVARVNEARGVLLESPTDTRPEQAERAAFGLARSNGGWVTPAQLSLDGKMGVDQAKAELDSLVRRGYADVRIRRNGAVVYVFPEFLAPGSEHDFEGY